MHLHIPLFRRSFSLEITKKTPGSRSNFQMIKDSFIKSKPSTKADKRPASLNKSQTLNQRNPFLKHSNRLNKFAEEKDWKKFNREMNRADRNYRKLADTTEEKSEWLNLIHQGSKLAVDYEHPDTSTELRRYVEKLRSI